MATKLILSEQEKQLILNSEWILTKHSIVKKVIQLFNDLLESFKETVNQYKSNLPLLVVDSSPKISKGENYLSLPYVMMDYPKIFNNEKIFAIRTMFWWGNFFSCTLHLSHHYKYEFENNILHHLVNKKTDDLYICINEDEWQHHFDKDNYKPVAEMTKEGIALAIKKQPFMKIAYKIDLQNWEILPQLLLNKFEEIIKLIA